MNRVYFDSAATTRMSSEALEAFAAYSQTDYGNSSALHGMGIDSERAVKRAEEAIMKLIGANQGRIVFTSGATESNNLAVFGLTSSMRKKRVLCSKAEHPSLTAPVAELENKGFEVVWLKPDIFGRISKDEVESGLNENTVLVSLSHVNSETGAVNDIESIGRLIRSVAPGCAFHVDAAQSLGKLPINCNAASVSLLSFSSHKMHAAKGCGGLYIAKGLNIKPILLGGRQQDGLRSGTLNSPAIASTGVQAIRLRAEMTEKHELADEIRQTILDGLSHLPRVRVNSPERGSGASPYILNISFPGVPSEVMMRSLEERGLFVSAGSACSSKSAKGRVLDVCGVPREYTDSSLRLSFSRYNTTEEGAAFCKAAAEILTGLGL